MTEGVAIEIAKVQMRELGIREAYTIRYRHLRIDPQTKRTIKGENHFFYLIDPAANVKIESKAGIYDMNDFAVNEQQHVHRGIIKLENTGEEISDVKFIQIIPHLTKK